MNTYKIHHINIDRGFTVFDTATFLYNGTLDKTIEYLTEPYTQNQVNSDIVHGVGIIESGEDSIVVVYDNTHPFNNISDSEHFRDAVLSKCSLTWFLSGKSTNQVIDDPEIYEVADEIWYRVEQLRGNSL